MNRSENSKVNILSRLSRANLEPVNRLETQEKLQQTQPVTGNIDLRIEQVQKMQEAVNSEVVISTTDTWISALTDILNNHGIKRLLCGSGNTLEHDLKQAVINGAFEHTELLAYESTIETFKTTLFDVDAAITGSFGAIAENGALILCPDTHEARTLSLVPPIHIALLAADTIYGDFDEVMATAGWQNQIPANVLLISGPSKTADIELVLTHGVHGPKKLIILIIR